ncbi:MAG: GxxExxY protein [Acidobacteriota bacterium]
MPDAAGTPLAHQEVAGAILKSFFDVYRELGYAFSEIVYRRALGTVLRSTGLEAVEEVPLEVRFRGSMIGRCHADIIVGRAMLIETKAAFTLEGYAQTQVLNCLKAAGGGVAIAPELWPRAHLQAAGPRRHQPEPFNPFRGDPLVAPLDK